MKKSITILGSTGSIGVNTLDVISRHRDHFEVFALTGATQTDLMFKQCLQFQPHFAVMVDSLAAVELENRLKSVDSKTRVLSDVKALDLVASDERVDIVMAAIVGAAGLAPSMAAAFKGKRLLLANKEALVVGGQLFLDAVIAGGAKLLPIDSEHSAIFQSLPENQEAWANAVDKIILTASGGPFRSVAIETLHLVTPEQACAHPNWVMGRKISVDSATMMNKALEVIEATYLFGVDPSHIEVVIHPQSIIHSMVQYVDGSVVAQLGTPDMKMPIAYGLSFPQRMKSGASFLDFQHLPAMTFESMSDNDHQSRFPGLKLAWESLAGPKGMTAVLNAANEVAVELFLNRLIHFDQIYSLNVLTLSGYTPAEPKSLGDLIEIDQKARALAKEFAKKLTVKAIR